MEFHLLKQLEIKIEFERLWRCKNNVGREIKKSKFSEDQFKIIRMEAFKNFHQKSRARNTKRENFFYFSSFKKEALDFMAKKSTKSADFSSKNVVDIDILIYQILEFCHRTSYHVELV